MHTIFWLENLKGRDHLEDLGVDGRKDNIRMEECGLYSSGPEEEPATDPYEHKNEHSGSRKGREFLD